MTGLFASPVKTNLKARIEARAKAAGVSSEKAKVEKVGNKEEARAAAGGLVEVERKESQNMGPLGLPNDPERDFEEVVREVREEIEMRHRKGFGRTKTTPVLRSPEM